VFLYLVFILLQVVPLLSQSTDLWGIDQWRYLPGPAVILLLLFGLLPLVPSFRKGLAGLAKRADSSELARRLKHRPSIGFPLVLAAAALLFWSFRQATHFLGDGNLWIKTIETGQLCRSWDLIVSCSLYTVVSRFIGMFGVLDARTTAALISVASGLVFLAFAWKTARQLSEKRDEQVFLLLAVLSTGSMMLFFGYIEAYPPAAAGLMIYLYYASRTLVGRSGPGAAVIACVAAMIFHPSMIALLPSLFVLYILRRGARPNASRCLAVVSITVIVGLTALWALQRWRLFGGYFHESFLPILGGGARNRVPYSILSWSSLVDLLNELLLVCPMILFSAVLLSRRERGGNEGIDRKVMFFGAASLYFVLIFIVGNKLLGVSRDWDVFAPMAVPLTLFTAVVLLNRYRRNAGELALFAGFILALHTVPWIAINASTGLSLQRFADLTPNRRWSGFARGYACDVLGTYYFYHDGMPHALGYSIAALEADPGNVRYLYNAATRHMMAGKHDDALRMFENVVQRKPDYLDARLNLGTIYMNMERLGDARKEFLEAVRIDSTSAMACYKLAHIYWKEGREEKAGELYTRAIDLDPQNPEIYLNLALLQLKAGGRAEARKLMERAIDVDSGYALTYYHLGKTYMEEGDMEKALELYGKHISLEPTALDARFEMAVALDRVGRLEEALRHLLCIYEERPGDVGVMNNIGVIYSKRGEFDQAVRFFEKALKVDQNQPGVLVNGARTYYRLGDYSRAWKYVIRAERLGATVPDGFLSDLNRVMLRPGPP
jgi:tetratricopeptide (TPR) repeat protein